MNGDGNKRLVCIYGVSLLGLFLLAATLPGVIAGFRPGVLLFLALATAAEAVHLPSRKLSVGFTLAFPAFILFGPGMAAWVSALGFVLGTGVVRRRVMDGLLGGARSAIAILAAAWVYQLLGGGPERLQSSNWVPLSFVSPVYFVVDSILVRMVFCDLKKALRPGLSSLGLDVAAHLVLTAFGLLLAQVSAMKGWYGILLVVVALAAAIHLMRLFDQLETANRELRILHEVAHRLNSTLRLERVFETMAGAIAELARPEVLALFLCRKQDQALEMTAFKQLGGKPLSEAEQAHWQESVVQLAAGVERHGDGRIFRNPAQKPGAAGHPLRSLLVVPLVTEDSLVGVLAAGHRDGRHFDEQHMRLVSIMAGQLAVAVENALLYEKTENMAITDSMTGLYNYRYFYVRLEDEVKKARTNEGRVSIIYLDLDRFKQYNDVFGHQAGDDILRQFSDILRQTVRQSDIPARYAGDEFVVILPGSGREEAWEVVRRIESAVAAHPFRIGARGILARLTFSAGVACFPDDALTQDELIYKADKAMYEAKVPHAPGEGIV